MSFIQRGFRALILCKMTFLALKTWGARPASGETLDVMKELHAARRAREDRAAAFNREKLVCSGLLKRQAAQGLREINTQIAAIDAAHAALRDADPGMELRFGILASIPRHRCENRLRDADREASPGSRRSPAHLARPAKSA